MSQIAHTFSKRVPRRGTLDYLLHLPGGYSRRQRYPLILFLHGSGERGSDVYAVHKHGIPKVAARDPDFPFVAVSPQCPANSNWFLHVDMLLLLLDDVMRRHSIDRARVYLTGISMGGYGAWHLGSEYPERFAAVVPICGGFDPMLGYPERVCGLRYTPVWAFHGTKDRAVPVSETRAMVRALRRCGGKVKLTVYPDAGHDTSWWPTERARCEAFLASHARSPHSERVSWETERVDRYNRIDWLVIDRMALVWSTAITSAVKNSCACAAVT
jgi:predicted peptidase